MLLACWLHAVVYVLYYEISRRPTSHLDHCNGVTLYIMSEAFSTLVDLFASFVAVTYNLYVVVAWLSGNGIGHVSEVTLR